MEKGKVVRYEISLILYFLVFIWFFFVSGYYVLPFTPWLSIILFALGGAFVGGLGFLIYLLWLDWKKARKRRKERQTESETV